MKMTINGCWCSTKMAYSTIISMCIAADVVLIHSFIIFEPAGWLRGWVIFGIFWFVRQLNINNSGTNRQMNWSNVFVRMRDVMRVIFFTRVRENWQMIVTKEVDNSRGKDHECMFCFSAWPHLHHFLWGRTNVRSYVCSRRARECAYTVRKLLFWVLYKNNIPIQCDQNLFGFAFG